MKKLLIVALMAVMASAGVVENTTVSYGDVDVKVSISGVEYAVDTKATSLKQEVGYQFESVQVLGYVQLDKYKEKVISDTESNAISYGIEADYIHAVNDKLNLTIGCSYGQGHKDLGSQGDIAGIGRANFRDIGARVGMSILLDSWQLNIGIDRKNRGYDSMMISGLSVNLDEEITSVSVGLGYRF